MAHPIHYSLPSVKKWGGSVEDYLACHEFFDASNLILADFRHRALCHHAEGIFLLEQVHGKTLTLSKGRVIPTGWVGEQHMREDLSLIPSFADWARAIRAEPWMGRTQKIEAEVDTHLDCPVNGLDSARKPEPVAVPLVSGMILTIGEVDYPCAPFNGFYFGTEIASFKAAGVKMVDHHTTSDQFMTFHAREQAQGRG